MSKQTIDPTVPSGLIQRVADNIDEGYEVFGDGTDLNKVVAGITASTTQTQGQGALTGRHNIVATVANDDDTNTLKSLAVNGEQWVHNEGANILQLFPASGQNLGNGSNNPTQLFPGKFLRALCTASNIIQINNSHNPVVGGEISGNATWGAEDVDGQDYEHTAVGEIELPPAVAEMNFTASGSSATVCTFDPNASQVIKLNGTALAAGFSIVSDGAVGWSLVASCRVAGTWKIQANQFSDKGS